MTPAEFKRKWAKYSGKETSAYQEHFNDLCALLGQPSPVTADPTGSESFCFQKRVLKDAEFFALDDGGHIKFFSVKTLSQLLTAYGLTDLRFSFYGRAPWLWKNMICHARRPAP